MKIYLIFFSVLLGTSTALSMDNKDTCTIALAHSALDFLGTINAETAAQNPSLLSLPREIQLQIIVKNIFAVTTTQTQARNTIVAYLLTCKAHWDCFESNKDKITAEINKKDKDVWLTKPIAKNSLTTHLYRQIGYKTWQR